MMAFFSPSASALIRLRSVSRLSHGLEPDLTRRWVMLVPVDAALRHLDAHRRVQELLGELGDFRRHGRREEQRLPGERDHLADALDVGDEAHVEHAVGFVDDEDLDAVEQQLAALAMVEQAAGRGDQHVGAALELLVLLVEGDAADQQRDVELVVLAVFDEVLLDLRGEFARRLEDQRARHAGPGAALFEARQHRQHEGGRLAGAGLGDAQNVLALQGVRNGAGLDRRRHGVAGIGDCGEDLRRQAEVCKGQRFLSGRGRLRTSVWLLWLVRGAAAMPRQAPRACNIVHRDTAQARGFVNRNGRNAGDCDSANLIRDA